MFLLFFLSFIILALTLKPVIHGVNFEVGSKKLGSFLAYGYNLGINVKNQVNMYVWFYF